jgi:hypothetical protein
LPVDQAEFFQYSGRELHGVSVHTIQDFRDKDLTEKQTMRLSSVGSFPERPWAFISDVIAVAGKLFACEDARSRSYQEAMSLCGTYGVHGTLRALIFQTHLPKVIRPNSIPAHTFTRISLLYTTQFLNALIALVIGVTV